MSNAQLDFEFPDLEEKSKWLVFQKHAVKIAGDWERYIVTLVQKELSVINQTIDCVSPFPHPTPAAYDCLYASKSKLLHDGFCLHFPSGNPRAPLVSNFEPVTIRPVREKAFLVAPIEDI